MLALVLKPAFERLDDLQAAFQATRAGLVDRPWAVDDLDQVLQYWQRKHYRKALLFVDNAGSDVILGECACVYSHDSTHSGSAATVSILQSTQHSAI